MTIKSIKHKQDKRVHIPSREEAGTEEASPKVKDGKKSAEFPRNPVAVERNSGFVRHRVRNLPSRRRLKNHMMKKAEAIEKGAETPC
ncbi:MAG: hypothetical protein MUC65_11235 [Pontiellaceae bacterium]|jgi:hypothetical protein|nr:hypothetical protein [Pontiellaceae bacterium]